MNQERINELKKAVLETDAVQRDAKSNLILSTKQKAAHIAFWLETAILAYDCGENQLGKDCIGRCLIILGVDF